MAASGSAIATGIGAVASPEVGGVRMHRHPLEREAARLNQIAHRVGKRLLRWVKILEDEGGDIVLQRCAGHDKDGAPIMIDVPSKDGGPIMVPILPDKDFLQTWELYERTVRNLLAEQRARAQLAPKNGGLEVDDATFQAEIADLARKAILEMPHAELAALVKLRAIDIGGLAAAPGTPVHTQAPTVSSPEAAGTTTELPDADLLGGFEDK